MKPLGQDKLRLSILAALSLSATAPAFAGPGSADTTPQQTTPSTTTSTATDNSATAEQPGLDTVVVTGSTSKRTLLDASVDVTAVTAAQLEQKAPRTTADVLSLIPGIFVE